MSRLTKISWVHKNGHRHSHRVSARWPPNGLRRQTTHKNIRNIIVNKKTDLFLLSCLSDLCLGCCVGFSKALGLLFFTPQSQSHAQSLCVRSFCSFMERFSLFFHVEIANDINARAHIKCYALWWHHRRRHRHFPTIYAHLTYDRHHHVSTYHVSIECRVRIPIHSGRRQTTSYMTEWMGKQ